jgi:hypothetical protein
MGRYVNCIINHIISSLAMTGTVTITGWIFRKGYWTIIVLFAAVCDVQTPTKQMFRVSITPYTTLLTSLCLYQSTYIPVVPAYFIVGFVIYITKNNKNRRRFASFMSAINYNHYFLCTICQECAMKLANKWNTLSAYKEHCNHLPL